MGNLSKGVRSAVANVGARWRDRKSLAEAQSLKARPVLSRGACNFGMAKAPRATIGVSFKSSRRLMLLNLRLSIGELINGPAQNPVRNDAIRESVKSYRPTTRLAYN